MTDSTLQAFRDIADQMIGEAMATSEMSFIGGAAFTKCANDLRRLLEGGR